MFNVVNSLELNDLSIKDELKKVQDQNLKDIKDWSKNPNNFNTNEFIVNGMSIESQKMLNTGPESDIKLKTSGKGKSLSKRSIKSNSTNSTANNFYINNNFFANDGTVHELLAPKESNTKLLDPIKEHQTPFPNLEEQQKILSDLLKNVSKLNEAGSHSKITRIMNFVIVIIAVVLLLATIYIQSNQ